MKPVKIIFFFLFILCFLLNCCSIADRKLKSNQIRGWNILSDNREMAIKAINRSVEYNINHLQLSHKIVHWLRQIKEPERRALVNELTHLAHEKGIKEVTLWDHALYKIDYYPDQFKVKIGQKTLLDFDNPDFWEWVKSDYREMLNLVPDIDGLILTFIETGSRAEQQYSKKMSSSEEKLSAVVQAVTDVVVNERNLKLYLRTFIHNRSELQMLLHCFKAIQSHPNIVVMTKEAPHDFFITHPPSYWVKDMPHPVIIEFDCAHEFNGQGIVASIFPQVHYDRWKYYQTLPNVIGYVNRTDRYGNTQIIGRPSEINLYTIKRFAEDPDVTIDEITDEFIIKQYSSNALPHLRFVFNSAPDMITSILYTLGLCLNNHSQLNFDRWQSYTKLVAGNWLKEPVVTIEHNVNKTYHFWKDIVNHLTLPKYKPKPGHTFKWYPFGDHLNPEWFDDKEMINVEYLKDVITEKKYGIALCEQVLEKIKEAREFISDSSKYWDLYHTFNRTRISGELYLAVIEALWGYRIYSRDEIYRTDELFHIIQSGLKEILLLAEQINHYPEKGPVGQHDWAKDAERALNYHQSIIKRTINDFGRMIF
jgi:hypothetical protein